jgi:deazaflavin-dependent oxidoreductase (nitroreductase family)
VANQVVGLHRRIYDISGGRLLGGMFGMPVLELTTVGRKSGRPRTAMLTSPVRHEGNYVIVASRGGDERHPAWYLNLVADPDVEVKLKGTTTPMHARVATPEERADLWPKVTSAYKGYAGYQTRTDREIPLVVLEPRASQP